MASTKSNEELSGEIRNLNSSMSELNSVMSGMQNVIEALASAIGTNAKLLDKNNSGMSSLAQRLSAATSAGGVGGAGGGGEGGGGLGGFIGGASSKVGSIMMKLFNVAGKAVTALAALVRVIYQTSTALGVGLGKAVNLQLEMSKKAYESALEVITSGGAKGTPLSVDDQMRMYESFRQEFGGLVSKGGMEALATEAVTRGLTAEELIKIRRSTLTMAFGKYREALDIEQTIVAEFQKQQLGPKEAAEFLAKNMDIAAAAGARFASSLARAAAESKRIGVDLSKTEAFADSIFTDYEGFLEGMAEVGAMGFGFDTSRLAEVAMTGDAGAMLEELESQLAMTGKDLGDLTRPERITLEKLFGFSITDIQRLSASGGVGEEPDLGTALGRQSTTVDENTRQMATLTAAIAVAAETFRTGFGKIAAAEMGLEELADRDGKFGIEDLRFWTPKTGARPSAPRTAPPAEPTPVRTGPGSAIDRIKRGPASIKSGKPAPFEGTGTASRVAEATDDAARVTTEIVEETTKSGFKAFAGSAAKSILRWLGRVGNALTFGFSAAEGAAVEAAEGGKHPIRAAFIQGTMALLGGIAGAALGTLAGGPVGTVLGFVGGMSGAMGGDWLGGQTNKALRARETPRFGETTSPLDSIPNFLGRKYHDGGIVDSNKRDKNELRALLRRGEGVLTEGQMEAFKRMTGGFENFSKMSVQLDGVFKDMVKPNGFVDSLKRTVNMLPNQMQEFSKGLGGTIKDTTTATSDYIRYMLGGQKGTIGNFLGGILDDTGSFINNSLVNALPVMKNLLFGKVEKDEEGKATGITKGILSPLTQILFGKREVEEGQVVKKSEGILGGVTKSLGSLIFGKKEKDAEGKETGNRSGGLEGIFRSIALGKANEKGERTGGVAGFLSNIAKGGKDAEGKNTGGIGGWLGRQVGGEGSFLGGLANKGANALQGLFGAGGGGLAGLMAGPIGMALPLLAPMLGKIPIIKDIMGFISNPVEGIKKIGGALVGGVKKVGSAIGGFFKGIFGGKKPKAPKADASIAGQIDSAEKETKKHVSMAEAVYGGVGEIVSKPLDIVSGLVKKIPIIGGLLGKVTDMPGKVIRGVWNGIGKVAGKVGGFFKGLFGGGKKKPKTAEETKAGTDRLNELAASNGRFADAAKKLIDKQADAPSPSANVGDALAKMAQGDSKIANAAKKLSKKKRVKLSQQVSALKKAGSASTSELKGVEKETASIGSFYADTVGFLAGGGFVAELAGNIPIIGGILKKGLSIPSKLISGGIKKIGGFIGGLFGKKKKRPQSTAQVSKSQLAKLQRLAMNKGPMGDKARSMLARLGRGAQPSIAEGIGPTAGEIGPTPAMIGADVGAEAAVAPTINVNTAGIEQKLNQFITALSNVQINMDGNKVGKVLVNSTEASSVAVLRGP